MMLSYMIWYIDGESMVDGWVMMMMNDGCIRLIMVTTSWPLTVNDAGRIFVNDR